MKAPGSKKRFVLKTLFYVSGLLVLTFILGILFSPYHYNQKAGYKLVAHSVWINATPEAVFTYLGDSDHARDWSVYVDHIDPVNPEKVPDGQVGSIRRCFCNPDSKGTRWDELITVVRKNKKRQLTIFNLQDFTVKSEGLASEQIYQARAGGCRLTFTLFYYDHHPSFWDDLKTYFAAYKVKSIFERNMNNIKNLVEQEVKQ